MKELSGRRILFIGIGFYDYERSIIERLREVGARVTAFDESPAFVRDGLSAGLLRRMRWCAAFFVRRYEQAMLDRVADSDFDQVLVIKGSGLSVGFLEQLRARQPRAEFILYQWDSLVRVEGVQERLPLFDRVLTFDRRDSIANPLLKFRPSFYREPLASSGVPETLAIDVSFVGLLHSDRLQAVRDAEASARSSGLTTFVYLYTGILTWIKLLLSGEARGVHLRPIPYATLMEIYRRTRCILDLPHPAQSGLTMRAVEALGLGKKLITTGRDIEFYDFYAAANIDIVDANRLRIDREFVLQTAVPIPDEVRRRYSLDAWIGDVFGVTSEPVLVADSSRNETGEAKGARRA